MAIDEVRRAEDDRSDPHADRHHPCNEQGAPPLGENWMPDAERSVQADDGQQKHRAEHVGVLEETVELAEEDAEGPVVEEELLSEGEDSCEAENQVCYRQIYQPHVGDLRLEWKEKTRTKLGLNSCGTLTLGESSSTSKTR